MVADGFPLILLLANFFFTYTDQLILVATHNLIMMAIHTSIPLFVWLQDSSSIFVHLLVSFLPHFLCCLLQAQNQVQTWNGFDLLYNPDTVFGIHYHQGTLMTVSRTFASAKTAPTNIRFPSPWLYFMLLFLGATPQNNIFCPN